MLTYYPCPGQVKVGSDPVVDRKAMELPDELRVALSRAPTVHKMVLDDRTVSWLSWGDPARRPLVFVHGGAAHGWWWSFTAPLFADRHHVVALDLSGHGDSTRRREYSFHGWVNEILAVLRQQQSQLPPVIVGHSMGGIVVAMLAACPDVSLGGIVVVDSPLSRADEEYFAGDNAVLAQRRRYGSPEEAATRFRLLPPQEVFSRVLLEHVARHSVRYVEDTDNWAWKFDDRVFAEHPNDRPNELWSLLDARSCPCGIIAGASSEIVADTDREVLEYLSKHDGSSSAVLGRVLDGGHHLMFDRPLELVDAIREFLREWKIDEEGAP